MKKLEINWENIPDYLSFPIQYRFIDHSEVIPGKEAWGTKAVSSMDWYFRIHFPDNPVMPGVLIMETMQQTGTLIIASMAEFSKKRFVLYTCESMRLYRSVRPGETITAHVVLDSFEKGIASFHGKIHSISLTGESIGMVCTMTFSLIEENVLANMSPSKQIPAPNLSKDRKRFDWKNLGYFIADPLEYRFIDAVEVIHRSEARGEKNISPLEWYFSFQSPECLAVPEAFLMESIMQTSVLTVTGQESTHSILFMFNDCKTLKFYRIVRPGEHLETHVQVDRYRNGVLSCSGVAAVNKELVCKMKFTLIAPDLMIKVRT